MSKRSSMVALSATAAVCLGGSASANLPPPPMPSEAFIQNFGSTNTMGFLVYLSPSGSVRAYIIDGSMHYGKENFRAGALPQTQAKKLFHDVTVAMPLTSLPVRHGMRSASFGTETFITYKGQKSPDLTFAADPRTSALKIDVAAITRWLGVDNLPRHPLSRKAL